MKKDELLVPVCISHSYRRKLSVIFSVWKIQYLVCTTWQWIDTYLDTWNISTRDGSHLYIKQRTWPNSHTLHQTPPLNYTTTLWYRPLFLLAPVSRFFST